MIASLGMYDMGPLQGANDRLWALIRDGLRARGLDAPDVLTRGPAAYWPAWESPDLLLSQTCGYPYRARLHGKVTLVGTPDYGLPDCPPGHYRSVFVARADDPRDQLHQFDGAALAYNDPLSQSGWAAAQNHAAHTGLRLRPALETGSHALSMKAVAEGRADIAALDALTFTLLQRHDPAAAGVKVVGHTLPTPVLPFISAAGADGPAILAAIRDAIPALSASDRDTLHLKGIVAIPATAYLAVPNPPTPDEMMRGM